jgi:hypothetical protein
VLSEMGAIKNPDLNISAVKYVRKYHLPAITCLYKTANIGQTDNCPAQERHICVRISKIRDAASLIVKRMLSGLSAFPTAFIAYDYITAAFSPLYKFRSKFGEYLPNCPWFRSDVNCLPVVLDEGRLVCLRGTSRQLRTY